MSNNNNERWQRCREVFRQTVAQKYQMDCVRQGKEPTLPEFLEYLENCNIIAPRTVAEYSVLELYPEFLYRANGRKRQAVYNLELILPYAERKIWQLLKNQRRYRCTGIK